MDVGGGSEVESAVMKPPSKFVTNRHCQLDTQQLYARKRPVHGV
jgi:hypothetical protein